MKIMIITVAGMASRFSQSIGRPCLKCLYSKNSIKESLLYHMLDQNSEIDKYVIVGGFRFDELSRSIDQHFEKFRDRIILVKNEKYEEYGSGYSLLLGLEAIREMEYEELVFAEGDLWIDQESFNRIWKVQSNVITCNNEAIVASKSVAFYYDSRYHIHYIFDTNHSMLEIQEPFLGIFNSGQIWKFCQREQVLNIMSQLTKEDWEQTNLTFIQRYFGGLDRSEYERIEVKKWVNCNTIGDFEMIKGLEEASEDRDSYNR